MDEEPSAPFSNTDPTCPICRDHGVYGDVNEETADVVEAYCPCAIGEARRSQ